MEHVTCFPPLVDARSRLLILGSMPGVASLRAQQYYAHRQNAFWSIVAAWLSFDRDLPYDERVHRLLDARIAVWDVLHSCQREGSADARIDRASRHANDFATFFESYPAIRHLVFNGATAEESFLQQVAPQLDMRRFTWERLPSTSPAYAAMSWSTKYDRWRAALARAGANAAST